MKTVEELVMCEGNGKVLLLNTGNGHWARMNKERFEQSVSSPDKKLELEKYLQEKFQLLEADMDFSANIRSVYFSVTGRCNLNCAFCTMNSGPDVSVENDLSLDEITAMLIPKLEKINPRKIVITGGEPLVRKDAEEIIKAFALKFGKQRIILQTNGLLLTEEWLMRLAEYIGILEISIENIFESDKLRKKMEGIFKCANKLDVSLSLSFVVDNHSRQYLKQAIDMCHKYRAALTTRIVALVGRAIQNNAEDEVLKARTTLEVQYEIIQYLLQKQYYEDTLTGSYAGDLQPKKCCGAFGKILAIHPDGSTYMCGNFKSQRYSMGNIREKSIEDICNDLNMKMHDTDYLQEFLVDQVTMCQNCKVKYFCPGPCVAETAENEMNNEKISSKCLAKKIMLEYAMFFYESKKDIKENLEFLANYMKEILDGVQETK